MKLILILATASFLPSLASSMDYDIDWPTSKEKGVHVLAITINSCETLFKIKDKDFAKFSSNERVLDEALQKAIKRANSGCKN